MVRLCRRTHTQPMRGTSNPPNHLAPTVSVHGPSHVTPTRPSTQVQLDLAPKMAEVYVELRVKKPQRRKLQWMEAADDTPSSNLLTTAAPSLVTESLTTLVASAATEGAMEGTKIEPAEVVQARSPPPCRATPHTHACSYTTCCAQATSSSPHSCKWNSRRARPL